MVMDLVPNNDLTDLALSLLTREGRFLPLPPIANPLWASKGEVTKSGAIVCLVPNSRRVESVSAPATGFPPEEFGYGKFESGDWARKLADWRQTNGLFLQ
jgi:hypothetical protein